MNTILKLRRLWLLPLLLSSACLLVAQGPPGQDPYNPPPGHGGVPPGQAKKAHGDKPMPPGQAKKYGDDGMPPGQARKHGDFRFRDQDRDHFYAHYRDDADRWRGRRRPAFVPGQYIAREYVIRAVPRSYWVAVAPPPPPGYQYGYYGGYIVAYDPGSRMIADVLDLVNTARGH